MPAMNKMNTYLNNHYEGMTPEKLIQMLYRGALRYINLTREGVQEKNIPKRGENLSKTIAIVSELYASLDPDMHDESIQFLRGLYSSILVELPKVALTNDIRILDRAYRYLERLDSIWETDVMHNGMEKQTVNSFNSAVLKKSGGYPKTAPVSRTLYA
jgi:flagellar protein FliS